MKKLPFVAVAATFALSLGACANTGSSPMDAGERISQRGSKISNYGDSWSDGKQDVKQGERMVEKSGKSSDDAQKDLEDARKDVAEAEARIQRADSLRIEGEQLIADGTVQMQRAEADYTVIRSSPAAIQSQAEMTLPR